MTQGLLEIARNMGFMVRLTQPKSKGLQAHLLSDCFLQFTPSFGSILAWQQITAAEESLACGAHALECSSVLLLQEAHLKVEPTGITSRMRVFRMPQ